jgi:hypothetical protein
MKRIVLTVIVGLLISVSAIAQSKSETKLINKANKAVEKVLANLELTEGEKETYFELQKARLTERSEFPKGLKESDPELFKEKSKANRKKFTKNVIEAFGKERGKEILEASKNKNAKKKNKKKIKG